MLEITPVELKSALADHQDIVLLCVREDFERDICKLPDDYHIPFGELQERYTELKQDKHIVVYCHSGRRSMVAADFLKQQGYAKVSSLSGGIDAWSTEIDPEVPRY